MARNDWRRRAVLGGVGLAVVWLARAPILRGSEDLRLPPPTYPAIVELRDAGKPEEGLARLERALASIPPEGQPVEASVLRAALLDEVGRREAAEPVWASVAEREPALRGFAIRALVRSLATRRQAAGAEARLADLVGSRDPRPHLDLALAVADAYRAAGQIDRAADAYRRVLEHESAGPLADAARLGLGAALEAARDWSGAVRIYREAQLGHRTAGGYRAARDGERRAARALGRAPDPFSEDEYRRLAARLRAASRFDEALEVLDAWRRHHPDSARLDVIEAARIDTLYDQRSNDEAIERCRRFVKQFPASPLVPRVRLTEFRLHVREGRTPQVGALGRDLFGGRVAGASRDVRWDAGVLLAAYLVSVGDVEGGLAEYRRLYQMARTAEQKRSVLWRAGVAALRAGQTRRALENLRALVALDPGGELEPAAIYWLGVAQAESSHDEAALETFLDLARRYPRHYYGLRAAERLERLAARVAPVRRNNLQARLRGPVRPFPALTLDEAVAASPAYRAASVLARAGLRAEAAAAVADVLRAHRRNLGLALIAVRASADAGDYRRVMTLLVNHFGTYLQQDADGLPDDFWRLAYPRPYWDVIGTAAAAHDVDPLLLFALMRRESRFDPQARSAVGAIGLLQVMPYTAAQLKNRAAAAAERAAAASPAPSPDQTSTRLAPDEAALAAPATNAAIAAALVARLVREFDGALAPIVASYNAGEARTGAWWRAAPGLSDDLFVDSMPYSETRSFVREVLTNYDAYKRIYAGARDSGLGIRDD